jgi:hypothetical protein
VPAEGVPAEVEWWEAFRVALAAFPPPTADGEFLEMCERLGARAVESPYVDLDAAATAVLAGGIEAGKSRIEELMQNLARTPEGWQSVRHAFDYNLDFFELGTIDAPEWEIANRRAAYATRAVAARAGLWGNHGYEADYALIWVDADGDPLDGANRYEMRFETPPPVDAFWSLTMYDVPDFYLVDNPIDRYSIGDRTPGLVVDPGGGITILLQHESPGPGRAANWLPAPAGPFRPAMRMYQPRQELLDGCYTLPPIRKLA